MDVVALLNYLSKIKIDNLRATYHFQDAKKRRRPDEAGISSN
jgi:hypothetical protein